MAANKILTRIHALEAAIMVIKREGRDMTNSFGGNDDDWLAENPYTTLFEHGDEKVLYLLNDKTREVARLERVVTILRTLLRRTLDRSDGRLVLRFRDSQSSLSRWPHGPMPITTFHHFPNLPTELRLAVWEMTFPPARRLEVKCVEFRSSYGFVNPTNVIQARAPLLSSTDSSSNIDDANNIRFPLAFQICRESRAVALKSYTLLQPVDKGFPSCYASPQRDVLCLSFSQGMEISLTAQSLCDVYGGELPFFSTLCVRMDCYPLVIHCRAAYWTIVESCLGGMGSLEGVERLFVEHWDAKLRFGHEVHARKDFEEMVEGMRERFQKRAGEGVGGLKLYWGGKIYG